MERTTQKQNELVVYAGTYTAKDSENAEGIFVYRLNLDSGTLKRDGAINGGANPSYLTLDPKLRFLYAVNESMQLGDQTGGGVSALAIDPGTAQLMYLNQQRSLGGLPCYVSVEQTGRYAFIANYMTGNIAMYPIQDDGRLGPASDMVQHHGSSANPQRQEGPHAHCIVIDPTNRFAFVADLGIDKVMVYQLDLQHGKLLPHGEVKVHAGAGPRHLEFHPNGKFAYLINEVDSTLTAFAYQADQGTLVELHTLSTLPADDHSDNNSADVHVSPSGKFVYGSNRGHDSIVIYAVDDQSGKLTLVGHESVRGKTPRNFAIDPTGSFLLVANQDTNNVVIFRVDSATGKLTATGEVTEVSKPVCLKIVRFG